MQNLSSENEFYLHENKKNMFLTKSFALSLVARDTFEMAPGGGGIPLYRLFKYVPPQKVGFLRCVGLKTGIHFAHFGLESGMIFEGPTGVYERIYRLRSKWIRNKEKYANSKRIWGIFLFAL